MMKTKSENPEIEVRIVPGSIKHWGTIKYRIAKHEIPWWKRNFLFNPWKVLYGRDFYGSFSRNYYLPDCERLLNRLKTLRDVEEYIREEKEKEQIHPTR